MKTFALSLLIVTLLGASASATSTSASSAVVEQRTPVVTEVVQEEQAEVPTETEEMNTIYFDAVELDVEEVEIDSEGDIDSL